jgi:YD repeat-containing protein
LGEKITQTGTGGSQSWTYDGYGHLTYSVNLAGNQSTYTYDAWGRLLNTKATEISGSVPIWTTGLQNLSYTYYNNGAVATITDNEGGEDKQVTTYQYDADGHQTLDQVYDATTGSYLENEQISYDALGRVSQIVDQLPNSAGMTQIYGYDANGNRVQIDTVPVSGAAQDDWYEYNARNEMVVVAGQGTLNSSGAYSVQLGSAGTWLGYDFDGNRNVSDTNGVTTTYQFTATGQLEAIYNGNGIETQKNTYDLAGNLTANETLNGNANSDAVTQSGNFFYDANNYLIFQSNVASGNEDTVSYSNTGGANGTPESGAALAGDAGHYNLSGQAYIYTEVVYNGENPAADSYYTVTTQNTYENVASSVVLYQQLVEVNVNGYHSSTATYTYDAQGNVVIISNPNPNNGVTQETFVNDPEGEMLKQTEVSNGTTLNQAYAYVNNSPVWSAGGITATTNYNYQPVSQQYPPANPGQYVVQSGDTLQSIALGEYGDASLWYLIADANGLSASQTLQPGITLTIPNQVTNVHNNANTVAPYNPSQAIGTVSPVPQYVPPPSSGGWLAGFIGALVQAIVTIASSFIPYVGPYVAPALGAAAGNVAEQDTTLIENGEWSWSKYFDYAGIDPLALASKQAGGSNFSVHDVENAAASAEAGSFGGPVLGNVLSQEVSISNNQQQSFDSGSLAGAAASTLVTGGSSYDPVANFVGGLASEYIQNKIDGGGSISWAQIAVNAVADSATSILSYKGGDDSGGDLDVGAEVAGNGFGMLGIAAYNAYNGAFDAFGNELGNFVVGALGQTSGATQAASTQYAANGGAPAGENGAYNSNGIQAFALDNSDVQPVSGNSELQQELDQEVANNWVNGRPVPTAASGTGFFGGDGGSTGAIAINATANALDLNAEQQDGNSVVTNYDAVGNVSSQWVTPYDAGPEPPQYGVQAFAAPNAAPDNSGVIAYSEPLPGQEDYWSERQAALDAANPQTTQLFYNLPGIVRGGLQEDLAGFGQQADALRSSSNPLLQLAGTVGYVGAGLTYSALQVAMPFDTFGGAAVGVVGGEVVGSIARIPAVNAVLTTDLSPYIANATQAGVDFVAPYVQPAVNFLSDETGSITIGGLGNTASLNDLTSADLGSLLGSGGEKNIYALSSQSNLVVALPKDGYIPWAMQEGYLSPIATPQEQLQFIQQQMGSEVAALNQLGGVGLPVVQNYGVIAVDGTPGILLENIPNAVSSKSIFNFGNAEYGLADGADTSVLNQNSIDDLQAIRSGLLNNNVNVGDLQYLIGQDGHVVINDPTFVYSTGPSQQQLNTIDGLIALAKQNIGG